MKTWIKRSLFGLAGATVVLGGLAACGGGGHAHGWSDERVADVRNTVVEKVGRHLDLNPAQKAKLGVLADEIVASRQAFKGGTDPRTDVAALITSERFDRSKAQQLLDQKTQVVQGNGPKLLSAFGDFYDSLDPGQQQRVRERLEHRQQGWWRRG